MALTEARFSGASYTSLTIISIFDDEIYREGTRTLLLEAAYEREIPLGELGFDDNHLHFMADIGLYKRCEVAKFLKGPVAKRFFQYFPA